MTEKLPRVTPAEAIKVLERAGFLLGRQSGSHKIYKNKEGKRVTVPYHAGRTLHPKVLQSIMRDANLTVEMFKKLLK
jgi:predicted RNA binding protein YcfA (HicA-like mRNA interferase family)